MLPLLSYKTYFLTIEMFDIDFKIELRKKFKRSTFTSKNDNIHLLLSVGSNL
jgi:hypothetical protein